MEYEQYYVLFGLNCDTPAVLKTFGGHGRGSFITLTGIRAGNQVVTFAVWFFSSARGRLMFHCFHIQLKTRTAWFTFASLILTVAYKATQMTWEDSILVYCLTRESISYIYLPFLKDTATNQVYSHLNVLQVSTIDCWAECVMPRKQGNKTVCVKIALKLPPVS